MFIDHKNIFKFVIKKKIPILNNFQISLAFITYLDLCLLRGWKGVKIIADKQTCTYYVIGLNPKKKKTNFEIFFPAKGKHKMNMNKISKILNFLNGNNFKKYLKTINIAFVEQNSTIAYYRFTMNLNKITGPLGRVC
ncbi:hypothetical protein CMESO_311 (nucleomorph) [Chroomonas mesostigmatica CCMP1168]|uniref:tRNA-splicing endonuclease subunit Sen15 domain-containing protein n=1 Tax=Chroomonas mesostigmatica CCMP1168 TaxID=1195612 RepID=J7G362_9CRYP|nr:hypothetical protein CMESO_311 [Chroomonas mesostigmatica CCMP1168]